MDIQTDDDPTDVERKRGKTIQQASTVDNNDDDCDSINLAASLPEIITEILIKLPVKTLLQFKSVCKSWRVLISDPVFCKAHLKASIQNNDYAHHRLIMSSVRPHFDVKSCSLSSVLHGESPISIHALDYPMKHPHRSVWIVGSVNGLVCIAIDEADVFLWNPSTRKSKRLPHSGVRKRRGQYTIYGFGYDESSFEYKVVVIYCVVGNQGSYETEVKIYGLKSDSWRSIGDFTKGTPLDDSGKFVSGSLHWAASSEMGLNYSWNIVSFDLAKETYSEISQPYYGEGVSDSMLGVLNGCLGLLCNFGGIKADVWVMKEHGKVESWSKLFSIPYLNEPETFQYSAPLFISRKNEVLLVFGSRLVLYNIESNIVSYPVVQNFSYCLEVDTYIESLVSPYPEFLQ
ncbi:F-box/kelch-repeat protein At3g23880-like [Impatiens glandulifera]|uniref:F-box/kelch-repeat protein At3g23880-like n=1 Tax=Impatiens glandulifera TaxID=253017 RepID=UPI001FB07BCB|nr:F-box/kelch-repeat protein At3g23880-like [Impatiens glandulifera]XP_047321615.1 F-box/kelch-repeat protein At3g23880-like [Impatiens glandulifera]